MRVGRSCYFWCAPDAGTHPDLFQYLVSMAEHQIWIWDRYFSSSEAVLLKGIAKPNIEIKIISDQGASSENLKSDIVTYFDTNLSSPIKAGCTLSVAQAKGTASRKQWKLHDRFLIIDKGTVFVMGTSGNYYHTLPVSSPPLSTGAYELKEREDRDLIVTAFEYFWTKLDDGTNVAYHAF